MYTNETTHFGIPLPLGSDLTTPMDYNESMQDVDTALFESKTDSGSALQKANQLQQDLATTNDNITAVEGRVTTLEGTSVTHGQAILQNTRDIADVRADALDMIVAKDEGTAQVASVAVAEGEYFRYNDVLYIATENIAIGDTIVPNENCTATNVGTELAKLNGDIAVVDGINVFTDSTQIATTLTANAEATIKEMTVPETGRYLINYNLGSLEQSELVIASIRNDTLATNYTKTVGATTSGAMLNGTLIANLTAGHVLKLKGYSTSNLTLNNVYFDVIKLR